METWLLIVIVGTILDVILILLYYRYFPKIQMWFYGMLIRTQHNIEDIRRGLDKHEQRDDSSSDRKTSEDSELQSEKVSKRHT